MIRLALVGSRSWQDEAIVRAHVRAAALGGWTVVTGCATRGVDAMVRAAAEEQGVTLEVFRADWKRHGRKAGPIRNAEIAAYADTMVAFMRGGSRGTTNAVASMRRAGKPVRVVHENPSLNREVAS